MNLNKQFYGCWTLLLLACFILFNGCTIDILSKWRDKDIVIDAKDTEWQDKQYYDEKTQTSIGIANDDSYIYMCLSTKDTAIESAIVSKGFIVWLNGTGGKAKKLGIRFPVVEEMKMGGQGSAPGGQGGKGGQGGAPGGQGGPGGGVNQASVKELKILTSKKDEGTTYKMEDASNMGISAKIKNENNVLVYELKVPLKKTDKTPYAVEPSAKNKVGIGFMLYGTSSSSRMSGDMGGGGGDMGGGGGGMGGGGGGGGGMDSRDSGLSARDISSMSNVFSFFSTSDDVSIKSDDDVSIINAQGGGGGGGMGGGGGDMGGGGGGMGGGGGGMGGGGGGMGGASQTTLEVWFNVVLATK